MSRQLLRDIAAFLLWLAIVCAMGWLMVLTDAGRPY